MQVSIFGCPIVSELRFLYCHPCYKERRSEEIPGLQKSATELTQKDVSMKTKQGTRRIILQKFISSLKKNYLKLKRLQYLSNFSFQIYKGERAVFSLFVYYLRSG